MSTAMDRFLMRNPDEFSLRERQEVSGHWAALERYTPENLALRRIEALASSASECRRQLLECGKDPAQFEFVLLR